MTATNLNAGVPRISAVQEQFEREFDFIHGFERNARHFANKVAVSDPTKDATLTYAELNVEANKLANALAAAGLKKGDAFGVALFNTIEFVVAYIASEKLGAIFCPINYNYSPNEVLYFFGDSRPDVLIYDAELEELMKRSFDRAKEEGVVAPTVVASYRRRKRSCPTSSITSNSSKTRRRPRRRSPRAFRPTTKSSASTRRERPDALRACLLRE